MWDAPDRVEPHGRDRFDRRRAEQPHAVYLVAADGAVWAGPAIASTADEGGAWNDFTGVSPAYRGRGVARALKVVVAGEMAGRGQRWIETTNNALNAPTLAVNARSATCPWRACSSSGVRYADLRSGKGGRAGGPAGRRLVDGRR